MIYPEAQVNVAQEAGLGYGIAGPGHECNTGKAVEDPIQSERRVLRERLEALNQEELCNNLRAQLSDVERTIRYLANSIPHGERRDQAILAFRHLEDSRMRLGKVIQHGSGQGKSVYDR